MMLRACLLLLLLLAAVRLSLFDAPVASASESSVRLPASGELVTSSAAVRAAPDSSADVVRVLHRFKPDGQFVLVFAVRARRDADGQWWYELSLPSRPNGQPRLGVKFPQSWRFVSRSSSA